MRQRKQHGAVHYFTGCLHALDNKRKKALKSFTEARKLGRESCGKFWVDLLRAGMLMADSVGAIQEQKNFAKRAGMIGLFTNDATPRTNEMKAQMRAEDYLRAAAAAFKPFPSK